ncbi:MAG: HD domain-containing protein [Bacillota bacterium]|nr:HD domain-containing protein [Bacillota bacterium]
MDHELYSRALLFAEQAHRGQVRKGSEVPYITHPVGVSTILAQYECGEDVVAAGLLHDVLEDTGATREDLELRFGSRIAGLVAGVTEEKVRGSEKVSWEERKKRAIEHLEGADIEVVALKAADALDNVWSILRDYGVVGEAVWKRFKRGRELQLDYYRRLAGVIFRRLAGHPLARELSRAVAELAAATSAKGAEVVDEKRTDEQTRKRGDEQHSTGVGGGRDPKGGPQGQVPASDARRVRGGPTEVCLQGVSHALHGGRDAGLATLPDRGRRRLRSDAGELPGRADEQPGTEGVGYRGHDLGDP